MPWLPASSASRRCCPPSASSGDIRPIADSGSLDSAVTFVASAKDTGSYWLDVVSVLDGSVTPGLFMAKHGAWPTIGVVTLAVLVALIALRLVLGMGQWLVEPLTIFRRRR